MGDSSLKPEANPIKGKLYIKTLNQNLKKDKKKIRKISLKRKKKLKQT